MRHTYLDPIDRTMAHLATRQFCTCEPITIAAGTMMAAGAVTSLIAANNARQTAKGNQNSQKNAQDDLILENRRRATTDYLRDVRLEQLSSEQENEAVSEKSGDIARTTLDAKGTTVASSAERGIAGGRSLDTILADFDFQQNQEVGRLRINQQMGDQQHVENAGADVNTFDARVTAVKPYIPRTQPPVDYFTPIFGLAGGMMSTTSPGKGAMGGLGAILGGSGSTPAPTETAANNYNNFGMGK